MQGGVVMMTKEEQEQEDLFHLVDVSPNPAKEEEKDSTPSEGGGV